MTSPTDTAPTDELHALLHWSVYGRRGQPSARRVEAGNRGLKPFHLPVTITWDVPVPRAEVMKIINGFAPTEMEDKWFVYSDGPDSEGKFTIHLHRSWTGIKIVAFKLQIPVGDDGKPKEEDAKIYELTWESDKELWGTPYEEEAKSTALGVCNWVLHVELEAADKDKESSGSGTGSST
ncbi:hypothetical protein BX600DRAFT_474731 [Xylariales sp. PMI_506]|nr:hypothetical protein BX600DRAFT_474731 [Xylariales sp. PMI_506]